MKSYCKNCETIQPSSFRPCTDVVTGASYEDLCCDSCHYIVATIEERKALAQPTQEPVAWLCKADKNGLFGLPTEDKACKDCFPVYRQSPQPTQEPVAWMYRPTGALFDICPNDADESEFVPLYTTPPQPAQEREALKLALEALKINLTLLKKITPYKGQEDFLSDAIAITKDTITAIKEVLEKTHEN